MNDPKYTVGQQVEASWTGISNSEHRPAHITEIKHVYIVVFNEEGAAGGKYQRYEDQIRLPKPSVEEAWEKAMIIIGQRSQAHWGYTNEAWDRETRHQVYQTLVAASIKITAEVKADVRRLIGIADNM